MWYKMTTGYENAKIRARSLLGTDACLKYIRNEHITIMTEQFVCSCMTLLDQRRYTFPIEPPLPRTLYPPFPPPPLHNHVSSTCPFRSLLHTYSNLSLTQTAPAPRALLPKKSKIATAKKKCFCNIVKKHPTEDGGGGGKSSVPGWVRYFGLKGEEGRKGFCERFLVNFSPLQLPLYTKSRPSPSLRANSIPLKHTPLGRQQTLSPAFQARHQYLHQPPCVFQALSPSSLSSSFPWLKAMNARISFVCRFNPRSSSCLHFFFLLSNSVPLTTTLSNFRSARPCKSYGNVQFGIRVPLVLTSAILVLPFLFFL